MMEKLHFDDLNIYVSVYEYINSNMYVLIEQNEVLVVDPHKNSEVENLLLKSNVQKVTVLLTHEHCDHTSGLWWFLENFDCTTICTEASASKISDKKYNRPLLLALKINEYDEKHGTHNLERFKNEYVWTTYNADIVYQNDMRYIWRNHALYFCAIPGHSIGSSFVILDEKYVFSGDSVLKEYPVIISFPDSDKDIFMNKTLPLIDHCLLPDMTILPGHGKPFLFEDILQGGKIHVELR